MAYRTPIHKIDNGSLLQMFSCYRLEDEDDWYLRLTWRNLVQVCRRWRYLIYDSCSHLDMCLLITNNSPLTDTPSHLPPLPLVIACTDITGTVARKTDNIHLGLQLHDRVRRVVLRAPASSLRMWLEPMNKLLPRLRELSLLSTTEEMSLVLPESLHVPDLRRLSLHGIGLPKGLSLLSSMIALSTLSLAHIRDFPSGHLVTQLQDLRYLEELSIGFAIPTHLPSSEGGLLPAPISPVTLPSLRRLTLRGVDDYLDNLVAQINAPVLERLGLTLIFDVAFTLVKLNGFIHRTEEFGCPIARVIFKKGGASIDTGCERCGIGKLSLYVECKPLDWQIDSATQVSIALGEVLSFVEELTLDLVIDGMPPDWENTLDSGLWHDLLLPFIGVKKLHIGSSLTLALSQALGSVLEGLALELLPKLQRLEVQPEYVQARHSFTLFVKSRESVGRPVQIYLDENPRSAEAENALDAVIRTYPLALDDPTIAPSFGFGDLPPTSPPHPMGQDIFVDYINYSAFDDTTPELVAGLSTNPSPESASDQDHPHTGRAGPSPQISNAKPDDYELLRPAMREDIAGGGTMFHQAQGWKWEGQMVTPDQMWAISTS